MINDGGNSLTTPSPLPPRGSLPVANDGAAEVAVPEFPAPPTIRRRRGKDVALFLAAVAVVGFAAYVVKSGPIASSPQSAAPPGIAALATTPAAAATSTVPAPATTAPSTPAAVATTPAAPATTAPATTGNPALDAAVATRQAALTTALAAKTFPTLDPPVDQLASAGSPEWQQDSCLDVSAANFGACGYGRASAVRHAVLIGDEDAISYLPMLRQVLPVNWNVQALTYSGCAVSDITDTSACTDHQSFVLSELQTLKPDIVFLADSAAGLPGGASQATVAAAYSSAVKQILPLATHVITLGTPPGAGDLATCATPASCATAPSGAWTTWTAAEKQVMTDASLGKKPMYIDTTSWFCQGGSCPAVVGATPVYTDGTHLTAAESRSLAPLVAAALGKLI